MTSRNSSPAISKVWFRLARVGWVALALNSLWTMGWTLADTWRLTFHPGPRLRQGFADSGVSPEAYFVMNAVSLILLFLCYFVVSALLFWRLPRDRMALFSAVWFMACSAAFAYPFAPEFLEGIRLDRLYFTLPFQLSGYLAWPLLAAFVCLYPDGRFVPGWTRYVALYWSLLALAWTTFPKEFSYAEGGLGILVAFSGFTVLGATIVAQVQRYRFHSTSQQRQQTKWMVYGSGLVLTSILAGLTTLRLFPYSASTPAVSVLVDLASAGLLTLIWAVVPLAVAVAMFRYRLWDIDLVIRRTLIYSALTVSLAAIYFAGVALLQLGVRALTSQQQPALVTVVSTLGIAALFTPLRRRIQSGIDRRFYRRKYDAAKTLAAFGATVRDEVDLNKLTDRLLAVVDETMQPAHVSLWLKETASSSRQTTVPGAKRSGAALGGPQSAVGGQ